MENDINRYIHTYIEYLLNHLYKVIPNNQKTIVEELIRNNNYKTIQIGRNISESYPNIDFSIYQVLENFRKLKEVYIKNNFGENLPHYSVLKQEPVNSKNCILKSEGKTKNGKITNIPYNVYIKSLNNQDLDLTNFSTEDQIFQFLRNADSHGRVTINYVKNKVIVKFKSRNNGTVIAMDSKDLYNLTRNYYEKLYKSLPLDEISIKKKQASENRFPNITSETELEKFLSNHGIIRLKKNITSNTPDISKDQHKRERLIDLSLEQRIQLLSQASISKEYIKDTFYRFCHIQDPCGINDYERLIKYGGAEESDITVRDFSQNEIETLKEYISKYPDFYSLNIYDQYAFINEIIRKNNLSNERYELEKILDSFKTDEISLKSQFRFPEDEIKDTFSLLTKAVFLSNKENLFDQNDDSFYSGINTNNLNISFIQNGRITPKQIFRRLKNSFIHYRYNYTSENAIDLNTDIHLYDEDNNGRTFEATIKLKDSFELILNINFLRELNDNFKAENDEPIELSKAEEILYYADMLIANKIEFKDLPKDISNNEDIILMTLLRDTENTDNLKIIKYVDITNEELVKNILFYAPDAIQYLEGYQKNQEIAEIVLSQCGTLINCFDSSLFTKDNILKALESYVKNGYGFVANILINIPDEFYLDEEFTKKAIEYEGALLGFIKNINPELYTRLKSDMNFARKVAKNGGTLEYFDDFIYKSPDLKEIQCKEFEKQQKERYRQRIYERSRNSNIHKSIYSKIRNRADDEKGRTYIQSDIETVLGLDRRKEEDTKKSKRIIGILKEEGRYYITGTPESSESILEELRKKGEFRTISDLNNAKLIIGRDINENIYMELGEE